MRNYLLAFLVVLVGCSSGKSHDDNYLWLNPDVQQKVQNSSEEIKISRPELKFSNSSTASNCEQYFRHEGGVTETAANYAARSHYLVCDALKLAETWPPKSGGKPLDQDLSLCSSLDLASFKHSLRPRIETENATLTQLFGAEAVDGVNTCTFLGEGRNFVLNAILLVKEPEKPKKMWVWVIDEILEATYRSYEPVWFVFEESKSMWIATQ